MNLIASSLTIYSLAAICSTFASTSVSRYKSPGCPALVLRFGTVRLKQRGRVARFLCRPGYILVGDRHTICSHGEWDEYATWCIKTTCRKPSQPPNIVIHSRFPGGIMNFYCLPGYQRIGPDVVHCDGTKWDNNLPTCLANNATPPLACTFDERTMCGWNHDLNHDFDWRLQNHQTESGDIGTGPRHDHTKGAKNDGYYMYIESSSRQINDTARLISPIYEKGNDAVCFEFFYHMYGATIGKLRAYVKLVNESWTFNVDKAFVRVIGNQGDRWIRSFTHFGPMEQDFQIVIEGVRGSSYVSDIAIDDVKLIRNCSQLVEIASSTSSTESWTDDPYMLESCKNRCGKSENISLIDHLITCDCSETCWDENRCCLDYYDYCILPSFASSSITTDNWSSPTTDIVTTTRDFTLPQQLATTTADDQEDDTSINNRQSNDNNSNDENSDDDLLQVIEKVKHYNEQIIITSASDQQQQQSQSNTEFDGKFKFFIAGTAILAALIVSIPIGVCLARKFNCSPRIMNRHHQSSIGDSQSDVRFLTSDEILDFSLQDDDL